MNAHFSRVIAKLVFPDQARPQWLGYAIAIALPLISLLLVSAFFTFSRAPFFVFFTMSVLIASIYGGWSAGVLATIISTVLNGLALKPRLSLYIDDPENLARVAVFAVAGLMISGIIGTIGSLQHKLEIQRERLRVTLTSIGDAVIATDEAGRITFMNEVAETLTGWCLMDAAGKPLEEVFQIINETTRAKVENPVTKVLQSGRIAGLANHTLLIRRDGSETPIDDSAAPIRDIRGQIVGTVLVFRNIEEQKKANAALVNAEKLASVGRLAATIAHEINNPLEAITNLLFIAKTSPSIADALPYLERAEEELKRAAEITRQTLSFARHENTLELVDIHAVVDSVLALNANKIQSKQIAVRTSISDPATAYGSRSEVRQVIGNLVGNALDALPECGKLVIRAKRSEMNGETVTKVTIADTGHGIPSSQLQQVFEPFFTTKKDVGTGLGLWVTKKILHLHGGAIRIRSAVGRGTVICITWPTERRKQATSAMS